MDPVTSDAAVPAQSARRQRFHPTHRKSVGLSRVLGRAFRKLNTSEGARAMSNQPEGVGESKPDLVETGNYPGPEDGPQDDVEQTSLPDFDEDLVDGADLEEQ